MHDELNRTPVTSRCGKASNPLAPTPKYAQTSPAPCRRPLHRAPQDKYEKQLNEKAKIAAAIVDGTLQELDMGCLAWYTEDTVEDLQAREMERTGAETHGAMRRRSSAEGLQCA